MAACKSCGARNPAKNGHLWGCGTTGKKADPKRGGGGKK